MIFSVDEPVEKLEARFLASRKNSLNNGVYQILLKIDKADVEL
jgi:hypothetical protein